MYKKRLYLKHINKKFIRNKPKLKELIVTQIKEAVFGQEQKKLKPTEDFVGWRNISADLLLRYWKPIEKINPMPNPYKHLIINLIASIKGRRGLLKYAPRPINETPWELQSSVGEAGDRITDSF